MKKQTIRWICIIVPIVLLLILGILYITEDKKSEGWEFFTQDANGSIEVAYYNGKLANRKYTEYFDNGEVKERGNFVNGKIEGEYVRYYENGQVRMNISYKDGLKDGPYILFYENGQIMEEGSFSGGNQIGKISKYDENGNIID